MNPQDTQDVRDIYKELFKELETLCQSLPEYVHHTPEDVEKVYKAARKVLNFQKYYEQEL
jgi:hypothetical protein